MSVIAGCGHLTVDERSPKNSGVRLFIPTPTRSRNRPSSGEAAFLAGLEAVAVVMAC
jgi:hypothetical protein